MQMVKVRIYLLDLQLGQVLVHLLEAAWVVWLDLLLDM